MTIEFTCSCGQQLQVPDRRAGKHSTCPACHATITVPSFWQSKDPLRIDQSELEPATRVDPDRVARETDFEQTRQPDEPPEPFRPGAMRANRRIAGKVCAICQSEIQIGEQVNVCEHCRLPFHVSCWEENGGCGTYGCEAAPSTALQTSDADLSLDLQQAAGAEENTVVCPQCGQINSRDGGYCSSCGADLTAVAAGSPQPNAARAREGAKYAVNKEPWLAAVLSLIVVGLGQFYNGDAKKGALMLGCAIVGGLMSATILWFAVGIWSAIDAYRVAARKEPLW